MKQRIFEAQNIAVDSQKLIVAGRILNDDNATVADSKISEKNFVVLMEKKVLFFSLIYLAFC